jgi:membrane associated rhomboid family serine protease
MAFMERHFVCTPQGVFAGGYLHTLLTAAFSQIGFLHLVSNMLLLYIVSEDVERIYGFRNMFVVYLFCGLLSSLAYAGAGWFANWPGVIGASGAVMGVAVMGAFYNPNRPVTILFVTVPLKALVTVYLVLDLVFLPGSIEGGSRIAHLAHLAGALGGFFFYKFDLRLFPGPGNPSSGLLYRLKRRFRRRPGLRVVSRPTVPLDDRLPEPVASSRKSAAANAGHAAPPVTETPPASSAPTSGAMSVDEQTRTRVDELLQKISRVGYHNLSDEEQAFLAASSRKYKR